MLRSRMQVLPSLEADAAGCRIRKENMDYFMIILPLKVALVIYIGYLLFH
jgi:hypothetical protein